MRRKIVGASWKNHISSIENGTSLAKQMADAVGNVSQVEIFFLPAYPLIPRLVDAFRSTQIGWGAQNVGFAESGAFTGEVPARMLQELGCTYAEIGHAERRAIFNETDEMVNRKVKVALKYGMVPVICIGETKEDKENGFEQIRLKTQVEWALNGLQADEVGKVILAYEPVWAIGQQAGADPGYVNSMHTFIRTQVSCSCGPDAAEAVRIIYGGSVTPESARELIQYKDIDGLFIGRFGLKAENFKKMVQAALDCLK